MLVAPQQCGHYWTQHKARRRRRAGKKKHRNRTNRAYTAAVLDLFKPLPVEQVELFLSLSFLDSPTLAQKESPAFLGVLGHLSYSRVSTSDHLLLHHCD